MKANPASLHLLLTFAALSCSFAWDRDADGMSDVFARAHSLPPGSAAVDTDGDGRSNLLESIAGTNPRDGSAAGVFSAQVTRAGANTLVSWLGIAGKRYQVQRTDDLFTWADAGAIVTGADAMLSYSEPTVPKRFYRVKALGSLDTDADGFDDWEEAKLLGSDPIIHDGDSDELSDAYELFYFGNLARTGADDADGDLILAKDEHTFLLDPLADDTASSFVRINLTYTANDELATYTPVAGVGITYQPDAEGNLSP